MSYESHLMKGNNVGSGTIFISLVKNQFGIDIIKACDALLTDIYSLDLHNNFILNSNSATLSKIKVLQKISVGG